MERLTPYVMAALLAAFAAWTALAWSHPGPAPAQQVTPGAAEGKLVWQRRNCMACHQIYGLGGYLGPDLTNVLVRRGPDYVRTIVRDGRPPMPQIGLSEREIDRLIDYMEYVGRTGRFPPEGRPLRGFNN